MNRKLRILLIALCVLIAAFSVWRLADYFAQNARTRRLNAENAALMNAATEQPAPTEAPAAETPAPAPETEAPETEAPGTSDHAPTAAPTLKTLQSLSGGAPRVLTSMYELHSRWPDTVGYLKIPCVPRIDFAVVQRDNTFYLNHDMSGAKNVTGAAFMDSSCRIWPRSRNLVIYAHNMKSGEMFGELHRMADTAVLAKSPFVRFSTLYEEGIYAPLFIGVCSVNEAPFWRVNFSGESDFDGFIAVLRKHSDVRLGTEAIYGDDLLTLVTCVDGSDDKRFIVVLRKARDGESEEALKRSVFPGG